MAIFEVGEGSLLFLQENSSGEYCDYPTSQLPQFILASDLIFLCGLTVTGKLKASLPNTCTHTHTTHTKTHDRPTHKYNYSNGQRLGKQLVALSTLCRYAAGSLSWPMRQRYNYAETTCQGSVSVRRLVSLEGALLDSQLTVRL